MSMRSAEDIARQFCTPLPGDGPLAAVFENVVVTARVAQRETLDAVLAALTQVAAKSDDAGRKALTAAAKIVTDMAEAVESTADAE